MTDAGRARLPDEPPPQMVGNVSEPFAPPYIGSGVMLLSELNQALNAGLGNTSSSREERALLNYAYENYVDCVVSVALSASGVSVATPLALATRRYAIS
jgi:hypothetical protein